MSESDFPVVKEQSPFLLAKDSIQLVPAQDAPFALGRTAHERWGTQWMIRRRDFPFWFLALVVAGRGDLRTPAGAFEIVPGRLFTVARGSEYTLRVIAPLEVRLAVGMGTDLYRQAAEHLGARTASWAAADAALCERVFIGLHDAARAGGPFAQEVCDNYWRILLHTAHLGRLRGASPARGALATFARAKAIVDGDPLRAPSVSELARRLRVDRSHLARLFVRFTGSGPAAYAACSRLAQAAELLAGGGAVGAVAATCGYADAFSFSKAFSRRYGVPPSRWLRR